jgi:hypothetical protein
MNEILAELFNRFRPEEQAQIKAAEAKAKGILAQGEGGVRDRLRETGSLSDRDWILEPRDEARAEATGEVFVAYCNVCWNRANPALRDSVEEFIRQVRTIREGVLATYGQWECEDNLAELEAEYESIAWLTHAQRLSPSQPLSAQEFQSVLSQRDDARLDR